MTENPDSPRSTPLSVALIVADARRRSALATAMAGSQARIVHELNDYPTSTGPDHFAGLDCDVVVVDLDHDTRLAVSTIEEICRSNAATTVMAYSGRNDADLLRRSMHAGAREFLIEPLLPETVAEALTRAFARRPHPEKTPGKILAFVAAKAGVGMTTLSANFAVALTKESGARVVVVDMDFQLGEIALGLGMTATFSIVDALNNVARLDRELLSNALARHGSGLAVLGAPEEYNFFHFPADEGAGKLFRILRQEFDYVVVDSGTCHGHLQETVFEMADKLYLVADLTLPALRNAHRLIGYLSTRDGNRRLEIILNRFNSRHGDIDEHSATKALGRPVNWKIPNGYAAARAAQDNGVPLAMENSPITRVLVQMARAACGKPLANEKKPGHTFSFFGSKGMTETVGT